MHTKYCDICVLRENISQSAPVWPRFKGIFEVFCRLFSDSVSFPFGFGTIISLKLLKLVHVTPRKNNGHTHHRTSGESITPAAVTFRRPSPPENGKGAGTPDSLTCSVAFLRLSVRTGNVVRQCLPA